MPTNIINRVGEKSEDAAGEIITIKEYNGTHDVVVEWADGTTQKTSYRNFARHLINKKGYRQSQIANNRIGEEKIMNCGEKAKIIAYRKSDDIDVSFASGYVAHNRTYYEFVKGGILDPNSKTSRLGEVGISSKGQKMTIIGYRNTEDIDVQFEDGTIVCHKYYKCFAKGTITNPNYQASQYVGRKKVMCNGQMATLIKYTDCTDVTVQFEDGTVIEHASLKAFLSGYIKNPNFTTVKNRDRVGDSYKQTCGMSCKIVAYRGAEDMDVEFEDGARVNNVKYRSFMKGYIRHPIYKSSRKALAIIGEEQRMNNNQMAKIVDATSATDITVQFEDGVIVYHKKYCEFKEGAVGNPNVNSNLKNRTGEKKKMACGLTAVITAYRGWGDMDIQFEDGVCKQKVSYGAFSKGNVAHPQLGAPGKIFFGFVTKKAFTDKGNVYYLCKCCECGAEDIMTPEQMIVHKKNHL